MSQLMSNICLFLPVKLTTGQSDSPHVFDSLLFASMLEKTLPPPVCVPQLCNSGAEELLRYCLAPHQLQYRRRWCQRAAGQQLTDHTV